MTKLLTENEASNKLQLLNEKERNCNERLITLKVQAEKNEKDLESLKKSAKEEYGVESLDGLRDLYKKNMEEKTNNILKYEEEITQIDSIIEQVEKELGKIEQEYA